MNTARRSPAFLPASLRRAMAALALAALAVVLLRPLCDALEPIRAAAASSAQPGHHSPEEPCCTSVGEGPIVPSSSALALSFGGPHDATSRQVLPLIPRAAVPRAAIDPPRRPPRAVPFHARTARILA